MLSCFHCGPTLCDPMDCGPPGSSVHRTLQARTLKWLPCPPPGDLPRLGDRTCVFFVWPPALAGGSLPLAPPGKPLTLYGPLPDEQRNLHLLCLFFLSLVFTPKITFFFHMSLPYYWMLGIWRAKKAGSLESWSQFKHCTRSFANILLLTPSTNLLRYRFFSTAWEDCIWWWLRVPTFYNQAAWSKISSRPHVKLPQGLDPFGFIIHIF